LNVIWYARSNISVIEGMKKMEFKITKADAQNHSTEGWVLPYFSDKVRNETKVSLPGNIGLTEEIHSMIKDRRFKAEEGEVESLPTYGMLLSKRLFLVGMGDSNSITLEQLRKAASALARHASRHKIGSLSIPYTSIEGMEASDWAQAWVEGLQLAAYKAKTYHQNQKETSGLNEVNISLTSEETTNIDGVQDQLNQGINLGLAYASGVALARDLVNMPANFLIPEVLANQAVEVAQRYGFEYELLNENDIQSKNMGALWAVGKGSVNPPRLVVLKYAGDPSSSEWLALVGKGVTFDTGGYSLKPKEGMEKMISDMGGSAAVIGAMEIIGRLKPNTNVMMVVPAAENMISGAAFKPGDVLHSYSGKTIEMVNSDAEGRLVLADGITYAKELGATRIIDVATLTGGVITALGTLMSGSLSNDDAFYRDFEKAAQACGEKIWRFPHDPEYRKALKSPVADVINSTGRLAHAIMGGLFIGEFVGETPWIHLDIAGTAFLDKEHATGPKGATGVMARSLAKLAGC
jgi:leucyl aminopeptidase